MLLLMPILRLLLAGSQLPPSVLSPRWTMERVSRLPFMPQWEFLNFISETFAALRVFLSANGSGGDRLAI